MTMISDTTSRCLLVQISHDTQSKHWEGTYKERERAEEEKEEREQ